jgi:two-component system chemotaxis sensor kinase CheA
MNMEQVLQTFFEESYELLGDMERILLDVETSETSVEQLNALFRTMHTIKGSAGLFALDDIVRFTHQVENVLDRLRSGEILLNSALAGLLLRCHDHVKNLLNATAAGETADLGQGEPLLRELEEHLLASAPPDGSVATPASDASATTSATPSRWLLSLRFAPDLLCNGMDPGAFFRYLQTLGDIVSIQCLTLNLPVAERFDPETLYLRYELLFSGMVGQQTLEDAFEFVREGSRIVICPQQDAAAHLAEVVEGLDEQETAAVRQTWLDFGLLAAPDRGEPRPAQPAQALIISTPPPEQTAHAVTDVQSVAKPTASASKQAESKFIKVEAHKLDSLINLIGELVIAGAAANLIAHRSGQTPLVEATLNISNLVEQIRAGTLSMRMIQIGEIFQRFPRVVRDVSKDLNKAIELQISGADTELDKSMVDKLGDPLMHIVRNAIDHGIESPEVRQGKGKSPEGHVWLNAYHESGSVVIEVADDGAGLNPARIQAKAVERGLLAPDVQLPEQEIFKLIFEPGFSTAEQVTHISGRGVGMDVVRKSLDQLHGSVDIDSVPDQGSTFRIRLPLTLAIIDGFLVQVCDATFVLPLEAVIECIELPQHDAAEAAPDYLNLRGEILPLLRMGPFFELKAAHSVRQNVVVIRFGDSKAGLVVDELLGEFQTVIKPLGSLFRHLKAVSGSTILGSGEVALILDVQALIQVASQKESAQYSLQHEVAHQGRAVSFNPL